MQNRPCKVMFKEGDGHEFVADRGSRDDRVEGILEILVVAALQTVKEEEEGVGGSGFGDHHSWRDFLFRPATCVVSEEGG